MDSSRRARCVNCRERTTEAQRRTGKARKLGERKTGVFLSDVLGVLCLCGSLLCQRPQIDLPKEHLSPFRLEKTLAARDGRLAAAVDDLAVEDVGDLVAVADAFERVPLAGGLLHVLLAAEIHDIFPKRIAAVPVETAAGQRDSLTAGFVIKLVVLFLAVAGGAFLDFDGQAAFGLAAKNEEV